MNAKSILLVDGDSAFSQALGEQIALSGEFTCLYADDMTAGLAVLHDQAVDLVLADGAELLRRMRADGIAVPAIVMLRDDEAESDAGDEFEPVDHVRKPFRIADLLMRIRELLRAQEQSEDVFLRIGPYRFYAGTKTLVADDAGPDRKVRLTEKETDILKYLYGMGAQVVSREELLTEVWGYNSGVTTHTLETHIYRLRQKIEADPSHAQLLVTDAGGYRLVA
jgi:DNA-binding response OmpR family regulator